MPGDLMEITYLSYLSCICDRCVCYLFAPSELVMVCVYALLVARCLISWKSLQALICLQS